MSTQQPSIAIIGTKGYPYVYGGYETLVKELAERLVQRNCRVTVYCHRSLFSERPPEVNGIRLVYVPGLETKTLSQLVHSFFSMIHAAFSDVSVVLVVNAANGPFGLISRLAGKPTAINLDGLEWLRPKWKGLGAFYFRIAARLATRWYDRLINDAEAMRQVYLQQFNKDSTVIAYGAPTTSIEVPELLDRWGLQARGYYLVVGRLIPDNNADLIIQGFLASDSQRKLVVVGDVFYKDAYADRLKALRDERLLFTGYLYDPRELAALYQHSHAYLHGHEFGGTNPTMIKALAYGCAIIALDTVFNREMLSDDQHGLYFEKNTQSLQAAINQAEAHPEVLQTHRDTARQGITARYDWEHITDQYLKVFRELLEQRGG